MKKMGIWSLISTLSVVALCWRSSDAAEAGIRLKQECGKGALGYLGYTPDERSLARYQRKRAIVFDHNQVFVRPEKPLVPGCFNLTAYNVQIRSRLDTLVAEFYMTVGSHFQNANSDLFKLPCKQQSASKCQCGAQDACMYCDFCDNFKEAIPDKAKSDLTLRGRKDVTLNRKGFSAWREDEEDTCKCGIEPGLYDINAEICSPSREELEKHFPPTIFALADDSTAFTLWTTLYVYRGRFNSANPHIPKDLQIKATNSRKRRLLAGCSVIGTDISFYN